MNICLISSEYPPGRHIGGIATYTYNVAHALSRLGHKVHVVTVATGQLGTMVDGDVTLHHIRDVRLNYHSLGFLLHSYFVAKKINGIGCTFDIVQASEWCGEAYWYSLQQEAPLISRLATPSYLVQRLNSRNSGRFSRIVNHMEKVQVKSSAGIISSTNAIAKLVCDEWRIPLSRVKVIPNSLDLDWIRSFKDVAPDIDLEARDYLLYYGRLEERKGVQIFAEALPGVLKKYPHFKAVFIGADVAYGADSMRQYVYSRCAGFEDRLVFLESLPQKRLFPLVARARLVILPSLWEAFGFACLEAMSLGRVVIASGGSGFEEIIENGISGYLVEPGNHLELERKIVWCLEHQEDVKKVERGAQDRAGNFRVENIALTLTEYYGSILQEMKPSRIPALNKVSG